MSYGTVIQRIKTLSEEATMAVSAATNSSDMVTVYDNFEQMEGVKEQLTVFSIRSLLLRSFMDVKSRMEV